VLGAEPIDARSDPDEGPRRQPWLEEAAAKVVAAMAGIDVLAAEIERLTARLDQVEMPERPNRRRQNSAIETRFKPARRRRRPMAVVDIGVKSWFCGGGSPRRCL
jgi:hypothetical protein